MPVEVLQERVYLSPSFSVSFQRAQWTRTPDAGPPYNLGALPLHRVTDYSEHLPEAWRTAGGVFVPVLPEEAIWLGFATSSGQPNAVQVELGDVNVVSGMPSAPALHEQPQDYLVCPPQVHWDGVFRAGSIQPFTAEVLLLNTGVFKTLRIIAYEPLPGRNFHTSNVPTAGMQPLHALSQSPLQPAGNAAIRDPYGLDTWDHASGTVLSVHFLEPATYEEVTGLAPPPPRHLKDVFTRYYLP
jgi:hypothetical protein